MQLSALLQALFLNLPPTFADVKINQLVLDSRQIVPGDLFIALKGSHVDGRQYIPQALAKGAVAVFCDAAEIPENIPASIPLIPIPKLQENLGKLAATYYQYPANQLHMIGVTGTNGKTSCTHFIAQLLQKMHHPCGLIGTLGAGFYGDLYHTGLTTPDAIQLQKILRHLCSQGAEAIAMEVSSHSIDQGRINAIPFEIGIFTNLTQDHLDYHGDMQTYAAVKRRFLEAFAHHVVINADDSYGRNWITDFALQKSVYAYSIQKPTYAFAVPLIYAEQITLSLSTITATVVSPWGTGELSLPLIGEFNLSNALAVLTALCIYGLSFSEVLTHFARLKPVAGRMQLLGGGEKPAVVVDYAHTPDALEKVLQTLRKHTQGKLVCVFGCGGNRDQAKRPLMAKIVEYFADEIIVTNDNPRHENPETIAKQILAGFSNLARVSVILDRSKAIEKSIKWAMSQDCILIAGKGAETYQQMGDEKIPFDDAAIVKEYLTSE